MRLNNQLEANSSPTPDTPGVFLPHFFALFLLFNHLAHMFIETGAPLWWEPLSESRLFDWSLPVPQNSFVAPLSHTCIKAAEPRDNSVLIILLRLEKRHESKYPFEIVQTQRYLFFAAKK